MRALIIAGTLLCTPVYAQMNDPAMEPGAGKRIPETTQAPMPVTAPAITTTNNPVMEPGAGSRIPDTGNRLLPPADVPPTMNDPAMEPGAGQRLPVQPDK